jgi:hypothetical protein
MGLQEGGEDIKQIKLNGVALKDWQMSKGLVRRRGGGTRKKSKDDFMEDDYREDNQQEGGDAAPGPEIRSVNMNAARRLGHNANPTITRIGGAVNNSVGHTAQNPLKMGVNALPALQAAKEAGTLPMTAQGGAKKEVKQEIKEQEGGKPKQKLVLAPSSKKKTRCGIVLAPPSEGKRPVRLGTSALAKRIGGPGTRKIKVQLSNMKKRITTAKVIHKDSKEKSIEEIRELLEKAKLIRPAKPGKQVPEDVLRNIYKDYLLLRNKAL